MVHVGLADGGLAGIIGGLGLIAVAIVLIFVFRLVDFMSLNWQFIRVCRYCQRFPERASLFV